MFEIRNAATSGFDRAIIAMRRERGGREVSDSEWKEVHGLFDMMGIREFTIGPKDKAECMWMLKAGDYDFLKYIATWAHVEAPAEWWAAFGGYFIAQSDVVRNGATVTRSVMTNYAHLRNLMENTVENVDDWREWAAIAKALEELPESWMLLENLEVS